MIHPVDVTGRGRVNGVVADEFGILELVVRFVVDSVVAASIRAFGSRTTGSAVRFPVAEIALVPTATSAAASTTATRLTVSPRLEQTIVAAAIPQRVSILTGGLSPRGPVLLAVCRTLVAAVLEVDFVAVLHVLASPGRLVARPFRLPIQGLFPRTRSTSATSPTTASSSPPLAVEPFVAPLPACSRPRFIRCC